MINALFPTFGRPIYGPWGVSESRGEKPHDGMRPPMDGMSHLGLLQSLHFGLPQSLHLRKKRGQLALPEYTHTQAGKKKQLESFITQKNSMDGITIPSEHWRN